MENNDKNIKIWAGDMPDYKLLDSGDKRKLEEIGGKRIVRAEPRAWWRPQGATLGKNAPKVAPSEPFETVMDIFDGIKAKIIFKESSKHIGIFPEQMPQWQWIKEKIGKEKEFNILNLFGYTGIASLVAARSGAKVTHVDASKQSVDWARENQKLSGLENAPIRWIVDDVIKFVKKEKNKGTRYDAIIMDPPSYGKGPKGEVWKIEEKLPELIEACRQILSDKPAFVIFNMYSTELSSVSVSNLLADMTKGLGGTIESGELAIRQQNSERLLPMSIFAIWQVK
jgi:23S rRNA (cytosine1962-C5)-methyltransferase